MAEKDVAEFDIGIISNNTCTVDFLTGTIKIYPMLLEDPLVCSSHEAHSL